ncbi:hypothetical protein ABIB89_003258 [Bradyrhizobium sp. JR3.12]
MKYLVIISLTIIGALVLLNNTGLLRRFADWALT